VLRLSLSLSLALLVGGCSEGTDALKNGPADLAEPADLSLDERDLSVADLKGPSCGEVVICLAQCGFTNLQCDQMCTVGAQPAAAQQAGALAVCTALNCLGSLAGQDGGGGLGGMFAIIACMTSKCSMQVNACEGFPFNGQ